MDYYLRDKIERLLFLDGYNKDQIIAEINKVVKEREDKEKEVKLQAAREKVADATAEYMKLLTGIDLDIAQFIKDAIKEEKKLKDVDFTKTKAEVKLSDYAVNTWLKRNGYSF